MLSQRVNLLIIFLLILQRVCGQSELNFSVLGINEGLSQNTVNAICQDQRGFMWFGTFDGLNRYDGYSFKVYRNKHGDSTSLRNNGIFSLFIDSKKHLWVGTIGGGLQLYDEDKDGFTWIDLGQEKDVIRCFLEDYTGALWIGTNEGIVILDPVSHKVIKRYMNNSGDPSSVGSNIINCLVKDTQNNIWVATENNGLDFLDQKHDEFNHFTHTGYSPYSLPDNYITQLYADYDGTLWVGTRSNGLLHFYPERKAFIPVPFTVDKALPSALPHHMVTCFLPESDGHLWVGTLGGGLSLMNRKDLTFIHNKHAEDNASSISKNSIRTVFRDKDNNLWVGTEGGGINFHDHNRKKFGLITKKPSDPNSLSHKSVLSITADPQGTLWIGTDEGGLNAYNSKTGIFKKFPIGREKSLGVSQHVITDLIFDTNSRLWIGTTSAGISILSPGSNKFMYINLGSPTEGGLSSDWIFCLLEDSRKRIWVGTNGGGLNMFEPSLIRSIHYMHNPSYNYSISNNYVTDVYEDSFQNLWVATWEGLNLFDEENKVFKRFLHNADDSGSISSNEIICLFEDSKKQLWIGTFAGLNLYKPASKNFIHYNQTDGLPNDVICSIQEDKNGNLWISTYMGISCFNPQRGISRNFNATDGLQGNQFNFRASYRSKEDVLYFGGINGLTYFNPDSIYINATPPHIEFTGFKLYNKPVVIGGKGSPLRQSVWNTREIRLKHNQSTFTFEFVALNYSASSKCQYRYKLDNFDSDWIDNNNNRSASYTNIPPGRYVFRVMASNNDNVWNTQGIAIRILITPPLWKTWWARGILLAVSVLLILLIYNIQIYKIKQQKLSLEIEVQNRTYELQQQKEALEHQAKLLEQANAEILDKNVHLEYQKEEIERQSNEIKRINSLLRLKNENLVHNVKEISKARVEERIVSFAEFKGIYPDDDACYQLIRALKEKLPFECKKCKNIDYYNSQERGFFRRCKNCGYRETVTDHTIFFQVKFPIVKAFYILYLISSGRSLTSDELSRLISLRRETCWSFRTKVIGVMGNRKKFNNPLEGWKELILINPVASKRKIENKLPD